MRTRQVIFGIFWMIFSAAAVSAESIDISDRAVEQFLASPFQFDYTTLTDDTSLRRLIDALDYQLAMIEYRQMKERTSAPNDSLIGQPFGSKLQERYQGLLHDGFLFKKLIEQRNTSSDRINRACIDLLLFRRQQQLTDPNLMERARTLAGRIADRLYKFHFKIDDRIFSAAEAVQIIESGSDPQLARRLYKLQHDSARVLANDASRLYILYNRMGELKGFPSTFEHSVSRLSFNKQNWVTIAENLKKATDAEYAACLQTLTRETGRDDLTLFEIELILRQNTLLPDDYFPVEKSDAAAEALLAEAGLSSLPGALKIVTAESVSWPALAMRLYPPFDNQLIKSTGGGFAYYRRLIAEFGRTLPWVFADSTMPYMLRTYPVGSEEMLTTLFEHRALDEAFLAAHFDIPTDELDRFTTYNRWITIFRLRQVLMNFLFDYYLSEGKASDPAELYWSLEKSFLGINDSSYSWIETLISGNLEKYPKWLAYTFSRVKTEEILYRKFNTGGPENRPSEAARFLIEEFCRPGRSQTLQEYISRHIDDPLSVEDIRRQLRLQ